MFCRPRAWPKRCWDDGEGVGVVVDPNGHRDDLGEHRGDRDVAPAEALHLPAKPLFGIDLPGEGQPDPDHARAVHLRLLEEPLGHPRADPDNRFRMAVGERKLRLRHNAGRKVGDDADRPARP